MKIELVTKKPYEGSGPRGVDVYARHLFESLNKVKGHQIILSYDRPQKNSDIVHYTYFDPFIASLEVTPALPTVVTVHDLIPRRFPDHFPAGIRGTLRWFKQKKRLQKVNAIITDSQCSKRDIARLAKYPVNRIYPVLLGPNNPSIKEVHDIVGKYDLPEKYILYVGDINWNKNIPGLIRAFASIKDPSIHLVLAGKAFVKDSDIPEQRAIKSAIDASGVGDRIVKPGFVDDQDMYTLYNKALLYVQPSWYEGFGLPVLEAMLANCPVFSSREGSLAEIGGDYVHYFTPSDEKGFASKLNELVEDSVKRKKFVAGAFKWATSFSWDRCAEQTLQVYEKVLFGSH